MSIFLNDIDACPIANSDFDFDFNQWLAVLVDTLNEVIQRIEDALNIFYAPSYTSAEIAAFAADLEDGILLYDSTLNVYVGRAAGSLVKFTVTPYP